jgi:hypothetical protein
MGDIADYYRDQEMMFGDECPNFNIVKRFTKWQLKDGSKIPLKKMSITHLQNCINMIDRRNGWREQWKIHLVGELKSRE